MFKYTVLLLFILVLTCSLVWAEDYLLHGFVFSCGGGSDSVETYLVRFTVGQSIVGGSQSDSLIVKYGYWAWPSIDAGVIGVERPGRIVPHFAFALGQNYPNPFNPTTMIGYTVGGGAPVVVTLRIYDVHGALVKTLVTEAKQPGQYSVVWDGRGGNGEQVSSGVYICRISAGEFVQAKKLVLLK